MSNNNYNAIKDLNIEYEEGYSEVSLKYIEEEYPKLPYVSKVLSTELPNGRYQVTVHTTDGKVFEMK